MVSCESGSDSDSDSELSFFATRLRAALVVKQSGDSRFSTDEKGLHFVQTPGGQQKMTVINESGRRSLILGSRKASAMVSVTLRTPLKPLQ